MSNFYFLFHCRGTDESKNRFSTQSPITDQSFQQEPSNDDEKTGDLESDDDMCAYEKLRMRNIAEREKLFRDLKISEMK